MRTCRYTYLVPTYNLKYALYVQCLQKSRSSQSVSFFVLRYSCAMWFWVISLLLFMRLCTQNMQLRVRPISFLVLITSYFLHVGNNFTYKHVSVQSNITNTSNLANPRICYIHSFLGPPRSSAGVLWLLKIGGRIFL